MRGQPASQYYFDRPISTLFNICFSAGFVLDGMEEPVFDLPPIPDRPLVWGQLQRHPAGAGGADEADRSKLTPLP